MKNKPQTKVKKQDLIYGFPKAVHELAEIFINRDILKCDSSLIHDLLQIDFPDNSEFSTNFSYDSVDNYYEPFDRVLEDTVPSSVKDQIKQICSDNNISDHYEIENFLESEPVEGEELSEEVIKELENLAYTLQYQDPQEIFEWWAVTEWLGKKLSELGEPVMNNDYGYWWGRTCTGQAIILDGTIQKIASQYADLTVNP